MQIKIDHVSFTYHSELIPQWTVLTDINLDIQQNMIIAIVGPSGSGKTTLIQHLNGLLRPTRGRVFVNGQNLADKRTTLAKIREFIGMVFQFPETQLFEETVYEDVAFGPKQLGYSKAGIQKRVFEALNNVGMTDPEIVNLSPFHLSGGEQRKIAIAGVLAMQPQVLVLDEPTVGLDSNSARSIENIMKAFYQSDKMVLFISHDMDLVARLADRIVAMDKGRIVFDGSKEQLFRDSEMITALGLEMPKIPQFMIKLKEKGISVPIHIYDMDKAKEAIKVAKGN